MLYRRLFVDCLEGQSESRFEDDWTYGFQYNERPRAESTSQINRSAMRKVLFTLHVYVALFAGIFVAILGVTGGIMAFEPEIDHLLHARLSYVTPHGRSLSLAQISDAIAR